MKTMMKAGAFLALGMLLMGCVRENMEGAGHAIKFGAQAASSSATRTTYSGDVFTDAQNQQNQMFFWMMFFSAGAPEEIERINWDDGDKIRIYSNEVSSPLTKYADYALTRTEKNGKYDYASSEPTPGDHGLIWGSGTHSFFSVYPAPTTSSVAGGDPNLSYSNGNGVVEAVLPADQSGVIKTTEGPNNTPHNYYGNMNLAYMTAATTGSEGSDVILSFTPIVTTFYITLTNTTGSAITLRRVALSSAANALTGTYQTTFTSNNARSYYYYEDNRWVSSLIRTDANSVIYSAFPNGLTLNANASVTVALFALPHNITQLTLTVTSDEKGNLSLPLKQNVNNQMQWIEFTGGHKHNISGLSVPDVSYYIHVDKSRLEYDYTGTATTAQQFTVTHTKTIGSNVNPGSWKTQIKNASNQWVDLEGNCPTWLENFPLNSTGKTTANANISDAAATSHTYQKNVALQPVTSHEDRLKAGKVYDASGAVYDNSTQANAVDLSKYNFINRRLETNYSQSSSRTTANTYVVSAPGWYKIPMVYGNLIENGQTVANACKGARWELGHLDYFKKATDANIYLGVNYPWLQAAFLDHARIHWEKYTQWVNGQSVTTGRQWSSGSDIGVVTDVQLNNSEEYMYFHVDENMIRPGNVLLATYGSDGDCCWSWQIWITDQKMDLITVDNNQVLPVNLGWIDDTEGQYYVERSAVLKFVSTEIGNLETQEMTVIQPEIERVSTSGWQTYYQWGRKDPMSEGVTNTYNDDGTVNKSILHPSNIMYDEGNFGTQTGSEYYDWTSANYNNLWDSQNRSWATPSSNLPNHKTVYDPSPRGFSVAPDDAWDGLASYGYSSFENGLHFYTSSSHDQTIFFPASGLIHYSTATLNQGGTAGFYWTIHPGQNVQRRASYSLRFLRDGQNQISVVPKEYGAVTPFTTPSYRAFAYSVRPVLYNLSAAPSDYIEGSVMEEIIFGEKEQAFGWQSNISNLNGMSVSAGSISIRFVSNNLSRHPEYDATDNIVTFYEDNEMIVSVPNDKHIIQINLYFYDDQNRLGITTTSSPENGGSYTDGNSTKDGIWRISSYTSGSSDVFVPNAQSVDFKMNTSFSGVRTRKIYGISVIYK